MSDNSYLKFSLNCISPIDGRYFKKTSDLSIYFSEFSFNKYRIFKGSEITPAKVLLIFYLLYIARLFIN